MAASLEVVQRLAANLGLTADLNSEVSVTWGLEASQAAAWRKCSAWLPTTGSPQQRGDPNGNAAS